MVIWVGIGQGGCRWADNTALIRKHDLSPFPPLHLSSSVRWYRIGTGQLPHDLIASAWYSEDITRDVCCVRQRSILFWMFKLHLLQHKWCISLTHGAG